MDDILVCHIMVSIASLGQFAHLESSMAKSDIASIKMAMRQDGGSIWGYKDVGRSVLWKEWYTTYWE